MVAAVKIEPSATKNQLFNTLPGYEYSHYCYASYRKSKGKASAGGLRPVIAPEERPLADLIHTTLWYETSRRRFYIRPTLTATSGVARTDTF